jgi:hypothetical protein
VVQLKEEQITAMQSRGIGAEPVKVGADGKPFAQDELYDVLWNFCRVVQRGQIETSLEDKKAIPLAAMQQKHKVRSSRNPLALGRRLGELRAYLW